MILSKFNRFHGLVFSLLLLGSSLAYAQSDSVLLKRAAELREAPGENARSLAALAARAPLTRLGARQGAWIQVRTAEGNTGWVHMFDVGSAVTAEAPGAGTNALRGLTSFFNRGSAQGGATTATSTVGIRGLGAEDLARAQPNMAAVAQADALRLDADQARQFASGAALTSRPVEALPAPAPVPGSNPATNNSNQ
ncbi:MAG: SH3 domain-containing protein [Polaromonas sp.]|uniref:SH3 domain-containing protein n=1 Tax=Polaromonas sp. TaxID=1869339 RepID=UPI00272EEEEE|nr:SH3 domain-containing protein [Polaromonas sp.]MDP1740514.1 SH3 domain-containing protein [Polaromonas sp.]MDP1955222.1 SH3 domain-containing protein [Polaromonas sp.]MDP3355883.1 SH3 domain-containing protein [Polaromonas sp.]MDP3751862.1 SH3 domain-containing protein [Polaromonas sp.]